MKSRAGLKRLSATSIRPAKNGAARDVISTIQSARWALLNVFFSIAAMRS
jgi:hypothetical protein